MEPADRPILIVEDDPVIAQHVRAVLEDQGNASVQWAADAEAALSNALRTPPSIAFLDVRLPGGIDGITVGRELRQKYGTTLIFVTGSLDDAVRQMADPGVFFIGKPFRDQEIIEMLALVTASERRAFDNEF